MSLVRLVISAKEVKDNYVGLDRMPNQQWWSQHGQELRFLLIRDNSVIKR